MQKYTYDEMTDYIFNHFSKGAISDMLLFNDFQYAYIPVECTFYKGKNGLTVCRYKNRMNPNASFKKIYLETPAPPVVNKNEYLSTAIILIGEEERVHAYTSDISQDDADAGMLYNVLSLFVRVADIKSSVKAKALINRAQELRTA